MEPIMKLEDVERYFNLDKMKDQLRNLQKEVGNLNNGKKN